MIKKIILILIGLILSVNLSFGKDIDVFSMSLYDLSKLKIKTASRVEQTVSEAPSIVTVITAEEIKYKGFNTIEDILNDVAGTDATIDFMGTTRIGIRGLFSKFAPNNRVKQMLDGQSLNTFVYGDAYGYFKFIPIENIKQIEIIRGPGSALYGANAFAGVINIITKTGDSPSRLSYKGGSYNTHKSTAELSIDKNDFNAFLYADYFSTDGPTETVESDLASKLFGPGASAVPGKSTNGAEYFNLHAKMNHKNNYINAFYFQSVEREHPIGAAVSLTDEDSDDGNVWFVEAGHKFNFKNSNLKIKTYYHKNKFDREYEFFAEETAEYFGNLYNSPYPEGEGMHSYFAFKTTITGAEAIYRYTFSDKWDLVCGLLYEFQDVTEVGFKYNYNGIGEQITLNGITYSPFQYLGGITDMVENGYSPLPHSDREVIAAYAQTMIDFADWFDLSSVDQLTATIGMRYDSYDDIGESLNPRIGIVCAVTKSLYFKLLYGRAFRAPNYFELSVENNVLINGNPDLDPETLQTTEFQIGYDFSERITSTATLFYTEIDDLIRTRTNENDTEIYENFGSVVSKGIEFETKYNFGRKKYAYINATFQSVKNTTGVIIGDPDGGMVIQDSFDEGNIPEIIANGGINYAFTNWFVGNLRVNYKGKRKRTEEKKLDESGNIVPVDNRDTIDGQTLTNLALTFENLKFARGFTFQVIGTNIFNESHIEPDWYIRTNDDYNRGGRSAYVKVAYEF